MYEKRDMKRMRKKGIGNVREQEQDMYEKKNRKYMWIGIGNAGGKEQEIQEEWNRNRMGKGIGHVSEKGKRTVWGK